MELFYNPHLMPPADMKQTFIARQWIVDEVVELTQRQPEGAGVQHVVIIGPRGMGKTTLLLMVGLSMEEGGISGWQAVRLREEAYAVTDLADLWLEVLQHLSAETHDLRLLERADQLKREYQTADELQAAAFALIKDWSAEHAKRVLLLVDNFDMILAQINEERDNARLRNVLMNDGTVMFVGAATSYFREARAYDQPLYNFFKIYNLESLKSVEIEELLRRRAALDGQLDFEKTLRQNASRLRALEYFTGGNPRLALMLYRVVTGAGLTEVRAGLEKLLDEVTPYFKGKIESLPAQQRKILDHIARVSGSTREGLTPAAIAKATRLSPNQVSAQLKRLAENGYVRAADLRGRHAFYVLSEPLLAVWCQMRFGRDARERIQWLVDFLRNFYDVEEICAEAERLESQFGELISRNLLSEAQETLEYRRYLVEAIGDSLRRSRHLDGVLRGYLELQDVETARGILAGADMASLTPATLDELRKTGCLSQDDYWRARIRAVWDPVRSDSLNATRLQALFRELKEPGRFDEFLEWLEQDTLGQEREARYFLARGFFLFGVDRNGEALEQIDLAVARDPQIAEAWSLRGAVLKGLKRLEEAAESFGRGFDLKPGDAFAGRMHGEVLLQLNRPAEAIISLDRVISIEPRSAEAWELRGEALLRVGRPEDALASLDTALKCEAAFVGRIQAARFFASLVLRKLDIAQRAWRELVEQFKKRDRWQEALSSFLLIFAGMADPSFLRQLICDADLDEPLFPLARALDYILTGDQALIEKLSPEVRGIVEQVVATLRASAEQQPPKPPSPPRKKRKTSRRASRRL